MSLICCIASHINSAYRLNRFRELLRSIKNQKEYPDKIFISISSDILLTDFINEINNLNIILNIEVSVKDIKLTQFQHYKSLVDVIKKTYKDLDDIWIMFSDDDDLWHRQRTQEYKDRVTKFKDDKDVTLIKSVTYAENINPISNIESININSLKIKNNSPSILGNYIDYVCRATLFIYFFNYCHEQALTHKYCDCYFSIFLRRYGGTCRYFEALDWMYLWIKDDLYRHNCDKNKYIYIDVISLCKKMGNKKYQNEKTYQFLRDYIVYPLSNNIELHISTLGQYNDKNEITKRLLTDFEPVKEKFPNKSKLINKFISCFYDSVYQYYSYFNLTVLLSYKDNNL